MGLIHGAAQFAWSRAHSSVTADRYLPESRDRLAFSVTWWQWWEQRFGAEAGMKLDEYCRTHGIH